MEVSVQLHPSAALPQGKEPPVLIGQEAGWAPGPVWTLWRREESLVPVGIEPARSPSLYRLSCPGSPCEVGPIQII
jgi:hypothetical protein